MEYQVETITAYNKNCVGCKRHNAEVMISFNSKDNREAIHDLFLTGEQAIGLIEALKERIKQNHEV